MVLAKIKTYFNNQICLKERKKVMTLNPIYIPIGKNPEDLGLGYLLTFMMLYLL